MQPNPAIPAGNPMTLTVTFRDANGVVFDPASNIQIVLTDPNGLSATYIYPADLEKVSEGVYSITVEATVGGGDYVAQGSGLLANGFAVTTPKVAQRVTK